VSGTQNVLDQMTAAITQRKQEKASPLTPVEGERKGPLAGPVPANFPYDYPDQEVRKAVEELRRQARIINEAADAVEQALRGDAPPATIVHKGGREYAPANETPAPEVADANGPAQASDSPEPAPGEWRCSQHGYNNIKQLTSRRGRTYWACTAKGCEEFQK
jgi:hypothetical protein